MGKKTFLKMNKDAQKRYLEVFPKSSHRFLLGGATPEKDAPPEKGKLEKGESKVERQKRLKREQFNQMTFRQKQRYLEHHPKSRHRFRSKTKLADDVGKGSLLGGAVVYDPNSFTQAENKAVAFIKDKEIRNEVALINRHGAMAINQNAVKALAKVQSKDLVATADALHSKRDEIKDIVGERLDERPKTFDSGLTAITDLVSGDKKKLDKKEHKNASLALYQIASVALVAGGVALVAFGAAPAAVLLGRVMLEMWQGSGLKDFTPTKKLHDMQKKADAHDKAEAEKKRKKKAEKDKKKAKKEQEQKVKQIKAEDFAKGKKTAIADQTEKEIAARYGDKPKKKKRDPETLEGEYTAVSAANDSLLYKHEETIDLILDQMSDVLRHYDAEDFHDASNELFATASMGDMTPYDIIKSKVSRYARSVEEIAYGTAFIVELEEPDKLIDIFKSSVMTPGTGGMFDVENNGDYETYHYTHKGFGKCVSAGRCDDNPNRVMFVYSSLD